MRRHTTPAWATLLAQNARYTDRLVRLTDLPEREFEAVTAAITPSVPITTVRARLCIQVDDFARIVQRRIRG